MKNPIEVNQHVKCLLKTGIWLEGIVQNWSKDLIILKTLSGKNLSIIHGGEADIAFTTLVLEAPSKPIPQSEYHNIVSKKIKEAVSVPAEQEELKKMTIKELLILKREQEQKILEEKMGGHVPDGQFKISQDGSDPRSFQEKVTEVNEQYSQKYQLPSMFRK